MEGLWGCTPDVVTLWDVAPAAGCCGPQEPVEALQCQAGVAGLGSSDSDSLPQLCQLPSLACACCGLVLSRQPGQPPFPSSHISRLRGSSSRCVRCLLYAEATRELPVLSPDALFPNET